MAGHSRHGEWSGRCVNGRQSGPRRGLAGTYSVRAPTDLRQLLADALLYDVLVVPMSRRRRGLHPMGSRGLGSRIAGAPHHPVGRRSSHHPLGQAASQHLGVQVHAAHRGAAPGSQHCPRPHVLAALRALRPYPHGTRRRPCHGRGAGHRRSTHAAERDGRPRAQSEQLELVAAFQRPREAVCFAGASDTADAGAQRPDISDAGTAAPSPCGAGRRRRDDVSPHPRHRRRRGLPAREAAAVVVGGRPSRTT
jgi:hypothetical protein